MRIRFFVNDDIRRSSGWEEVEVNDSSVDDVEPEKLKGLCHSFALLMGYYNRCSIENITVDGYDNKTA
jgi:hypothetical protein